MATYRLTSPEGETFDVTAPEGATQDAVMRYARAMWKKAPKAAEKPIDPTDGMSEWEKGKDGAGQAMYSAARGVGQLLGLVSQDEIDAAKKMDAPLMDTGAGIIGNIKRSPTLP